MTSSLLAYEWPIRLEYFRWYTAVLLFVGLSLPIVLLGMRSLSGLGAVRKWVAIGTRLGVLLLFVMILGGMRWQRQHKNVEVIALRDVSESTRHVKNYPDQTLQASIETYLTTLAKDPTKKPGDTIGMIRFQDTALIDAMPDTVLNLYTRAIPKRGTGTN